MLLEDVAPQDPEILTSCPSLVPQVPNPLWQPSAQYATVLPQNPFSEQQLPKVDVRHVALKSEFEPQLPSLLTGLFERERMKEFESSKSPENDAITGVNTLNKHNKENSIAIPLQIMYQTM
jgi:hypothetical protein